jgi:hypothetical protein
MHHPLPTSLIICYRVYPIGSFLGHFVSHLIEHSVENAQIWIKCPIKCATKFRECGVSGTISTSIESEPTNQ